ncbi:M91 family zinc metallopeptidase [Paenimyroides aestuarii]|uniref:M91 family zinc metallopeptidase n=1 Tax=Paenimyroides aestuarii TaxID=2968490 RepID=A0ABY5NVL7_9FLAO|nr:M91 family zinc metallopeptidase [Paenimyroides aestuarii]UUV22658.1 M91 family zinc metallopeptidase [Paenimyroides aestuarii]
MLKFFPHPEGYVEFKNNQYLYTYQYKDHLGNVRLTYRDGFRNHPTLEYAKDGVIQVSEIIEKSDYYPFGLKQKGNDLPDYSVVNKYKYKFGGKELNNELGLDLYDFGARNYDAAIGRWLNIDPLAENSRRWTPYNYAYNNPIYLVDPDGMQAETIIIRGTKESYTYNEETKYTGNDKFIKSALQAMQTLQASQTAAAMIEELDHSNHNFYIQAGDDNKFTPTLEPFADPSKATESSKKMNELGRIGSGGIISWNQKDMLIPATTSDLTSKEIIFGHEMGHALDSNRGKLDRTLENGIKKSEWQAVYRENLIRSELGLPLRTHYGREREAETGRYLGPAGSKMLGPNNEIIKPYWYE